MDEPKEKYTPTTKEEQLAMVEKKFGTDCWSAYVTGFIDGKNGSKIFDSLRETVKPTQDLGITSNEVGGAVLRSAKQNSPEDVTRPPIQNAYYEYLSLSPENRKKRGRMDNPGGELAGRASALDSEQRREYQRKVAMLNLSRSRAAEFVRLMQQHDIPTVDLYNGEEVIGKGWVVEPSDRSKGIEYGDETYDGLMLLDDLQTVKMQSNMSFGRTQANMSEFSWGNTTTERPYPPFGTDTGLDLLALALRRLGVR